LTPRRKLTVDVDIVLNLWSVVLPDGRCLWSATNIAQMLDCRRGWVTNVIVRARGRNDPRAIRRKKGWSMSYSTDYQPDLLEKDAATKLRDVGYSVSFKTTMSGRMMTAEYKIGSQSFKWTFDVHNGRYLAREVNSAISDLRTLIKHAREDAGLTTPP